MGWEPKRRENETDYNEYSRFFFRSTFGLDFDDSDSVYQPSITDCRRRRRRRIDLDWTRWETTKTKIERVEFCEFLLLNLFFRGYHG